MPRLVEELTPTQVEWLIENQNAGEAGILETERMALNQQLLGNAASVFRSSIHTDDISETSSARKRKRERRDDIEAPQGSRSAGFFPHRGLKLTWDQSFENLEAYKNFYGVSLFIVFVAVSCSHTHKSVFPWKRTAMSLATIQHARSLVSGSIASDSKLRNPTSTGS